MAGAVLEGILNVVGFASGALGIVSFVQGNLPPQDATATKVRVYAGAAIDSISTSGNVPGLATWDWQGKFIGSTSGSSDTIPSGQWKDISIDPVAGGDETAEYLAISNGGKDALCIAAIAVTFPDAGIHQGWTGDIGYKCGADWYNSQTEIGTDSRKPKCVWIDRDESNGLQFQGMGIHLPDFVATEARGYQYGNHTDTMCSGPRFAMYPKLKTEDPIPIFSPPLQFNDDSTDTDLTALLKPSTILGQVAKNGIAKRGHEKLQGRRSRRSDARRVRRDGQVFMQGHLVTSGHAAHSAKELCESGTSAGPDFVSTVEGLFCDMAEKEVWPLCLGNVTNSTQACFDTSTNTMQGGSNSTSQGNSTGIWRRDYASGRPIPDKSYTSTHEWF